MDDLLDYDDPADLDDDDRLLPDYDDQPSRPSRAPHKRETAAPGTRDRILDNLSDMSERRWIWLFWLGIGIAGLAVLLLVLSSGALSLRICAVFAIISTICIGLSAVLGNNATSAQEELHDELTDEIRHEVDLVRDDLATLRRGLEMTVNRELERVRKEVSAARGSASYNDRQLPAGNGYPASSQAAGPKPPAFRQTPPAPPVVNARAAVPSPPPPPVVPQAHGGGRANGRAHSAYENGYSEPQQQNYPVDYHTGDHFPDVHTIEPIREEHRQAEGASAVYGRSGRTYQGGRQDRADNSGRQRRPSRNHGGDDHLEPNARGGGRHSSNDPWNNDSSNW